MSDGKKIIIIKKKKAGHHGHHGGSWKVAYADFVTAMMAFFLVMWIMGMDEGVKDMVQGYFTNPVGFKRAYSGGLNILSQGSSPIASDVQGLMILSRREQREAFERTAGEIRTELTGRGLLADSGAAIEVVVTDEGLRIELMETDDEAIFFSSGSATLTNRLDQVLNTVAEELDRLPNPVVIEGHTDAAPFGRADYTNWELSVDRANAARRALLAGGLGGDRIAEVRGYAETRPKSPTEPFDPRNRRISLLLPFREEIRLEVVTPGDRIMDGAADLIEAESEAPGATATAETTDETSTQGAGTPGGGGV